MKWSSDHLQNDRITWPTPLLIDYPWETMEKHEDKEIQPLGIQHNGNVVYTRILMQWPEIPRAAAES
jgi:hypothetical protein